MSEEYVVVTDPESNEPVELPTEDGQLASNTLEHAFPGAHGLKYKNPATGAFRALLLDETGTKFLPPAGGWENKVFTIVMRPTGGGDESEHGKKRKGGECSAESSDDDNGSGGGERKKKAKKLTGEDKAVCSDLIVLGLPYKLTDEEMREYFSQFGTVVLSELKKNPKGESRGFGFIQMGDYAEQIRVLSKPNHLIGGRKCQVRMPLSKNGEVREPNLVLNPKLFVTRLPERITVERLNEFFAEEMQKLDSKATVLDVYVPKPFRGFAFITLSSPAVAKEMVRQGDFVIDGASIAVTAAVPRDSFSKPRPPPPFGMPTRGMVGGPYADSGRMGPGPRNGPVAPVGYDRYGGQPPADYSAPVDYYDHARPANAANLSHWSGRKALITGPIHNDYASRENTNNASTHGVNLTHWSGLKTLRYDPSARYYEVDRSRYPGYPDERANTSAAANRGGEEVLNMNPEVVTAAFKAFLSAAQQSMSSGGATPSNGAGNARNGASGDASAPAGYEMSGAYDTTGMVNAAGATQQWH